MLVETQTANYRVGETWTFKGRPGEDDATLTVVKVESAPNTGVIVHISIDGVRIRNPHAPGGISSAVTHMPVSEAAMQKSVITLVAKNAPLPEFEDGYAQWRAAFERGEAGVFTTPIADAVGFLEKALSR